MIDAAFALDNKVAMVVGASNGIGRATALVFAAAGAAVACADVEEAGAKTTAADIEEGGAHALPVHLDDAVQELRVIDDQRRPDRLTAL